ncbi:MAG: 30S ribosomal protein S20, partial [Oscillospiraceae bacterium]
MPNIKSAKKRVIVNGARAQRNKSMNSALKTAIKKANTAIESSAADKDA